MIRKECYPVKQILKLICADDAHTDLDDDIIKVSGVRLNNFAHHGVTCVRCGITGIIFIKEKHHASDVVYHLNLYAINDQGHLILMTKDHIVPRSRGGSDELSNMQPMCHKCNGKKDNRLESELTDDIFKNSHRAPKPRKYHVFGNDGLLIRRLKNMRDLVQYFEHSKRVGLTCLTVQDMESSQILPIEQIAEFDTISNNKE